MTFFSPASNDGVFTQLITTPFYPSFKRNDQQQLEVSFNNGYVFDYSNADKLIKPISVSSEDKYTLSETDKSYFLVELTINKLTGEVRKGKIVKKQDEPEADDNAVKILPITSTATTNYAHAGSVDVHNASFDPDAANMNNLEGNVYFKWLIRLADFEGEMATELYLRDNLHINFSKFRQCGTKDSSEFPLIAVDNILDPNNPDGHNLNGGNGILSFYGLKVKKPIEGDEDYNIMELTVDGEGGMIELNANSQGLKTAIEELQAETARLDEVKENKSTG